MQLAGKDSTQTAHAGILAAARAIVRDLQSHHTLSKLLLPDSEPAQTHENRQRLPDCKGWRLVVTGHSLGAGASLLVGLYLRNYFPHVRVWAFEPPGGLAGPSLAEAVQDFATSVVLGKDWIPRLTLRSFERLRDDMITAAAQCRLSKARFLWGAIFGAHYRARRRQRGRSIFSPAHEAPPEAKELIQAWSRHLERGTSARSRYEIAREFCVAGRIMFLRPVKHKARVKRKTRRYQPVWISPEDLLQEGILVSPRMMADHMPDYVTAVLRRTTAARGNPVTNSQVALDVEDHDNQS